MSSGVVRLTNVGRLSVELYGDLEGVIDSDILLKPGESIIAVRIFEDLEDPISKEITWGLYFIEGKMFWFSPAVWSPLCREDEL